MDGTNESELGPSKALSWNYVGVKGAIDVVVHRKEYWGTEDLVAEKATAFPQSGSFVKNFINFSF